MEAGIAVTILPVEIDQANAVLPCQQNCHLLFFYRQLQSVSQSLVSQR
jgi:hypothetical protein